MRPEAREASPWCGLSMHGCDGQARLHGAFACETHARCGVHIAPLPQVFGLWVAALRALMNETEPVFFTKVASPLNPINMSAIASIRKSEMCEIRHLQLSALPTAGAPPLNRGLERLRVRIPLVAASPPMNPINPSGGSISTYESYESLWWQHLHL